MMVDPVPAFQEYYGRSPEVVASAPGRIEFIGNHTDYNGGLVLGAAIDRVLSVAAALGGDERIRLRSVTERAPYQGRIDHVAKQEGALSWANYPLGVWVTLQKYGMKTDRGFDFAIASDIPHGAGLSSSAALDVASALALAALYDFEMDRESLVRFCREADNAFIGVPSGILDQGVSAFGKVNHFVLIDCYKESFATVPLPDSVCFWTFDTGIKHELVAESPYEVRHGECMEALGILRKHYPGLPCLAHAVPEQVMAMEKEFSPNVFARARHVTEENIRVKDTVRALEKGDLGRVGELLYASHESSRTLFENSTRELDNLVELLREHPAVYGARLTGGGFGGAVMALTQDEFSEADADVIASAYAERYGRKAVVFRAQTAEGARIL